MKKRKWTNIKAVEAEIIKMREEGRTRQEIADALGLEKAQIKEIHVFGFLVADSQKSCRTRILCNSLAFDLRISQFIPIDFTPLYTRRVQFANKKGRTAPSFP